MRLYCFPFAGGTAAVFHGWRVNPPAGVAVHAVEYPGHGARWGEPADETVEDLAGRLADELHPPYALLGHSFGALVAFQVARRLRDLGAPAPARLVVSAARAPHLARE